MFATPAYAQAAGGAASGGGAAMFLQFLPLVAIFAIMYLLLFRPQQQRMKQHRAAIDAVRKGDTVVTGGGLIGKVVKVDETEAEVEIANGVKVRVVKATISEVRPLASSKPAND
ncbi:preprotein translocase subunit YajC [Sphingomonas naphthae]|uniref:Sec translocon accessory complex subunit YajC n=1 Tax=Sphingomonas naphthae TaxID=1813468 RepID=A0ABY7TRH2_9SPHN|nr:preprotein translocase subunit YajC [Sphingomonas naphthae]WCT74980.1 preprotein translocase subunit YajC [Sphingomonas naphthae]